MTGEDYNRWLCVAMRLTRRRDDAADLLQDAMLVALRQGRGDLGDPANCRWLRGTIRKLAAFHARSAIRRKRRETRASPAAASELYVIPTAFFPQLSPATRKVATLIAVGLNREEIQSILGLSHSAFRQRLSSIRKAWKKRGEGVSPATVLDPVLQLGIIRRALVFVLRERGGLGAYDPDGHPIILVESPSQKRR